MRRSHGERHSDGIGTPFCLVNTGPRGQSKDLQILERNFTSITVGQILEPFAHVISPHSIMFKSFHKRQVLVMKHKSWIHFGQHDTEEVGRVLHYKPLRPSKSHSKAQLVGSLAQRSDRGIVRVSASSALAYFFGRTWESPHQPVNGRGIPKASRWFPSSKMLTAIEYMYVKYL